MRPESGVIDSKGALAVPLNRIMTTAIFCRNCLPGFQNFRTRPGATDAVVRKAAHLFAVTVRKSAQAGSAAEVLGAQPVAGKLVVKGLARDLQRPRSVGRVAVVTLQRRDQD